MRRLSSMLRAKFVRESNNDITDHETKSRSTNSDKVPRNTSTADYIKVFFTEPSSSQFQISRPNQFPPRSSLITLELVLVLSFTSVVIAFASFFMRG
ncbi:MAG TPA: hypothetical protein VLG69_03955 [Candidatus Andersenbacteria bacterium]|nr:hypothetical protein [Candidatus Andersenbacteria bacterium]